MTNGHYRECAVAKRRRLAPHIRREEILVAAERLLTARGTDVRVEDVVHEAGAAKGTFYLYFPTWDDLLETVRERIFTDFDSEHTPSSQAGDCVDWLSHLEVLAGAFVDATVKMGRLHQAIFHSEFAHRRPMPVDMHPVGRLTTLLRAGQATGIFREIDPEPMARLLFAVIHEAADAVADGADREQIVSAMREVLRRVLAQRREPHHPKIDDCSSQRGDDAES